VPTATMCRRGWPHPRGWAVDRCRRKSCHCGAKHRKSYGRRGRGWSRRGRRQPVTARPKKPARTRLNRTNVGVGDGWLSGLHPRGYLRKSAANAFGFKLRRWPNSVSSFHGSVRLGANTRRLRIFADAGLPNVKGRVGSILSTSGRWRDAIARQRRLADM